VDYSHQDTASELFLHLGVRVNLRPVGIGLLDISQHPLYGSLLIKVRHRIVTINSHTVPLKELASRRIDGVQYQSTQDERENVDMSLHRLLS
jgi:hypothetical protein